VEQTVKPGFGYDVLMAYRTDQILELEAKLDALSKEVVELRTLVATSIRKTRECPECRSSVTVHAKSVSGDLSVTTPGLFTKGQGYFEMHFCARCGFTEWYVKEPGQFVDSR
jgi:ribosomal protein S27AE